MLDTPSPMETMLLNLRSNLEESNVKEGGSELVLCEVANNGSGAVAEERTQKLRVSLSRKGRSTID